MRSSCDNNRKICRANNTEAEVVRTTVPAPLRRSLNHCNLPAEALGSLAFQLAPQGLELDGILPLHAHLFERLDSEREPERRTLVFTDYMRGHFALDDGEALGRDPAARHRRLDYLRVLRGWHFDADSREGAVLKAWVESRFGLLTCFHKVALVTGDAAARLAFEREAAAALYGTGGLETQLDLLYAYCQYELRRRHPCDTHFPLYRGTQASEMDDVLAYWQGDLPVVLLNNLCSFSSSRERADEFGDRVMRCDIPLPKILCYSRLLPGRLQGEDEFLVIGGAVSIQWLRAGVL